MFLSIIDDINKFMKPVRQFIDNNYNNPFFWLGIVAVVLGVCTIAYSALHRGE